jgi:hypothetical protein
MTTTSLIAGPIRPRRIEARTSLDAMTAFLQKVVMPSGWSIYDATALPGCVVLRHDAYGMTTIDTKRRLYAAGFAKPDPHKLTMTFSGRGWEQRIVNDAAEQNAGFWNAA